MTKSGLNSPVSTARGALVAPPGQVGALADRILVHTSWTAGRELLGVLSPDTSGLVLRGSSASTGARDLRRSRYGGVLVIDPEGYTRGLATAEAPFVLPEPQLFETTLEQVLQSQRDCGASVTLTPTGFLRAGDSDALKAGADIVAALDRDDVLFSVPIDIAWLINENIGQLIAVLDRLAVPKAVFLGGQFDPLDRYKGAVSNLRRLVAEAGHVAVFRTDLTGFDALARGAFAASIGTGGSLRHVVPYGEHRRSSRKDESPSVLFGEVMAFFKGTTIAERFANTEPPACPCPTCRGRSLTRFRTKRDSQAAHAHGVHTWTKWIADLLSHPTLEDRARWWRDRCGAAVAYYDVINAVLEEPDAFTPPKTLRAWAELPVYTSVTQTAPPRSPIR